MEKDLRQWLDRVEKSDKLKVIKGTDWNLDLGAVAQLNWKTRDNPALLFDEIKSFPPGYRVLTGSTATAGRIALTYGLDYVNDTQLLEGFRLKLPQWLAARDRFRPVLVDSGPVMENVFSGDDVDLLKFPTPLWHEGDGGRYIGTGCAVVTKSPFSDEVNLGTYRIMLHDRDTLGLFMVPGQDGHIHCGNYHQKGERCPVAVSFGHHPLFFRVASTDLPAGAEYGFIGAVQGRPVEVIREEITGLPIPANSEIVIAGWCPPEQSLPEGPFGEYTGYYGRQGPAPIIKVERIYHRKDPIILGSPPGRPPNDSSYFMALMRSVTLLNSLNAAGIPDVRGVWACEVGGPQIIIVSLKQRYAGHAKQAAVIASQCPSGNNMGRYVIVVDEDIDPTNIQDVLWALAYRSDPGEGIDIIRGSRSNSLDPELPRTSRAFVNNVAVIDACKPFERIDSFPREVTLDPGLEAKMRHYLD